MSKKRKQCPANTDKITDPASALTCSSWASAIAMRVSLTFYETSVSYAAFEVTRTRRNAHKKAGNTASALDRIDLVISFVAQNDLKAVDDPDDDSVAKTYYKVSRMRGPLPSRRSRQRRPNFPIPCMRIWYTAQIFVQPLFISP